MPERGSSASAGEPAIPDERLASPPRAPAVRPGLSLVVTTLGRVAEVERLFRSLTRQHFTDFDLWLVDQNEDDRLAEIAGGDWPFRVSRLHVPGVRGASRGRNLGWREATGPVVLFPDDDCWYAPDFLARGMATMTELGCDMLTGRPADEAGRTINGRFEDKPQWVDRDNSWTTAIEWLVFFRRETLEAVNGFDETVGVGAATPWQSAEIQDIILRAMTVGHRCWYDPALAGHHEEILLARPDRKLVRKARVYARGMGYVLRRHRFGTRAMANWVVRPLGGSLIYLLRARPAMARYYAQVALGRAEGVVGSLFGREHPR